jgi:hypothetical protein
MMIRTEDVVDALLSLKIYFPIFVVVSCCVREYKAPV